MKIYLDNNLGVEKVEQEELTQDTIGYNILKVYIPNAVLTPYDTFTCYYGALLQNGRKVGWFAMEARTSSDADYKANYTLYKATLEQCVVSVEGKVYIGCQILLGNSGNATLIKKNTAVVQFNVRKSVAINNDILVLDTDQTTTDVLESYKNLLEKALTTYATKATTYTKTEVDEKIDDISAYTKSEIDTMINAKADKTTVEGINTRVGALETDVADLKSVQNVVDVVSTKSALNSYDTTKLDANDKVQVIADESHDGASTIYNWNGSAWQYVGAFGGNSYTKQESDNKFALKSTAVAHDGNQLKDKDENNIYPNLDAKTQAKIDNAYGPAYVGKDTSAHILAFTSDKGIWVGSDTGHWYYWNGTQYVDGGVYQATAINDGSVKLTMFSDQLNFDYRQYPHNLFFGSTDGYYRDYRTGKIETFSDFTMSHFIEIEPDRDYYTNMEGHICYFDENQTYISGTLTYQSGYLGAIHTPVNARYLVMSFWKRHKEIATLHTGTRFKWTLPYTYDVVDYSIIKPKLFIGKNMPLSNLFEAFEFIRSRGISNTDIIIRSGVYDLATEIGDTYISNFDPYTNDFRGLMLGNGNHIKGEGNVVINLRLPITANTPFRTDVSVFHAYSNSFTLENVTINAENVRYCVHDDTDVIDGYNSIHKFINCTFNDYGTTSGACIGGGLHSADGQVIIESCRCYIVGSRSEKDKQIGIYYHSYANTGRYIIWITDTKIYNGFCFLGQYQSPTNYIYMYVSNSQMMEIPHIYGFQDNPPKWLVDTPITYDYFSMEYWNIEGAEIDGSGGSSVVANPTLAGTEADLTGLEVNGTKYKVSSGGGSSKNYLHKLVFYQGTVNFVGGGSAVALGLFVTVTTSSSNPLTLTDFISLFSLNDFGLMYSCNITGNIKIDDIVKPVVSASSKGNRISIVYYDGTECINKRVIVSNPYFQDTVTEV